MKQKLKLLIWGALNIIGLPITIYLLIRRRKKNKRLETLANVSDNIDQEIADDIEDSIKRAGRYPSGLPMGDKDSRARSSGSGGRDA